MQGGGGPLLTGTSVQSVSGMSSRIYFGICPTIPVVRNVGQTLNQSCSTREKRHREKRGFRLVPLLGLAFTMAARLSRFHNGLVGLRSAFTMAEILLSLTIIGVVAAITLPSLTGNINERTWNTQRKALYARFSQAIALMPSLNGYGTLREITDSAGSTSIEDTAAETFVTSGLSKVLKINNICDSEHLKDCGIPSKLTTIFGDTVSSIPKTLVEFNELFDGSWTSGGIDYSYSQIDTKAVAFETANGESILTFYNPNCRYKTTSLSWYSTQPEMCVNFVYDLNGTKGPNTFGKDIGFITALYPSDPVVVAPMPLATKQSGSFQQNEAMKACKTLDSNSRLPNKEELAAIFYNKNFVGLTNGHYWSSTPYSSTEAWLILMHQGTLHRNYKIQFRGVHCVKL